MSLRAGNSVAFLDQARRGNSFTEVDAGEGGEPAMLDPSDPADTLQYRLLGPLQVGPADNLITPTAPKVRSVLALLALRHGQLVQTWELVDELWGDSPPRSAQSTLQTYIYKLRRLLCQVSGGSDVLQTQTYGYLAAIPPEQIDLHRFNRLSTAGRLALARGDAAAAADLCRDALTLWRGPALAALSRGRLLHAHAVRLEEERLRMLEARIGADLILGRHRMVIAELMELTRTQWVHEGFCRLLMIALYRSERRGEALAEYRRLRQLMLDELALEPGARVQQVHRALLSEDLRPEAALPDLDMWQSA